MAAGSEIAIVGRFPPPVDGQALATERLASLLEQEYGVYRFDVDPGAIEARRRSKLSARVFLNTLEIRRLLRKELARVDAPIVLWPSVSPTLLGHCRDRISILPAFHPSQKVAAVVHRGNFDDLFRRHLTAASSQRMTQRIERFVFLTSELSKKCSAWLPPEKRTVIPNTVDDELVFTDEEVEKKQEQRRENRSFRLLFVANMIASKGYRDALEATRLLVTNGTRVEIQFVGQWMARADHDHFHKQAKPITDRVVHHGAVSSRDQMKALYAWADAYVLPTHYENEAQPLTIIEALNAGLPIVTTRHAGIPEMVHNRREALFVAPRDPAQIARAVEELLEPVLWSDMSRRARARFLEMYSPVSVRKQWSALIREMQHT